jgi:hypothetical protein
MYNIMNLGWQVCKLLLTDVDVKQTRETTCRSSPPYNPSRLFLTWLSGASSVFHLATTPTSISSKPTRKILPHSENIPYPHSRSIPPRSVSFHCSIVLYGSSEGRGLGRFESLCVASGGECHTLGGVTYLRGMLVPKSFLSLDFRHKIVFARC